MWSLVRWVASSFAVDSVSRNLVSGSTRWTLGTPDPIFLRENRTFTLLLLQVSKFDQQDIFAGERVELTSGQTATVLEVFASNGVTIFYHSLSQVVPETYYSVAFDDGTFCDNHDPEEVKYEQGTELGINTEVK